MKFACCESRLNTYIAYAEDADVIGMFIILVTFSCVEK